MENIDRELEKLTRAVNENYGGQKYPELYAARQALAWALNPASARSPYDTIMDIPAETEGCLAEPYQQDS